MLVELKEGEATANAPRNRFNAHMLTWERSRPSEGLGFLDVI